MLLDHILNRDPANPVKVLPDGQAASTVDFPEAIRYDNRIAIRC